MKAVFLTLFLLLSYPLSLSPLWAQEIRGEIVNFNPPTGYYYPGDAVTAGIEFQNTTTERNTFWVGYSVQDRAGDWYHIPAREVSLVGEETAWTHLTWSVPTDRVLTSGPYRAVMAIWTQIPHDERAVQLDRVEAWDSFSVFNTLETFTHFNSCIWRKKNHQLGYSRLHPRNVQVQDEELQIIIPAGTRNGGGISTHSLYLFGSYEIRMKLPDAPSSITGFFLYYPPDFEHEIDIEIYNDPKGEIFFTTYARGERSNTQTFSLGFDPTQDFYHYRFDFFPNGVTFSVEGEDLVHWSKGLSHEPMYLMINTWFPHWLEGIPPEREVRTQVDWVRF